MNSTSAQPEIERGERFAFGQNWSDFLKTLDENRIEIAIDSLRELLQVNHLKGKSFLDAGSGSGLFALAATKLDATVVSFDFDEDSVECSRSLREMFGKDADWTIHHGSVLDQEFLESLGEFDIVYSWGVLHHTGSMWQAMDLTARCVKPGGKFALALYNDQGWLSKMWLRVKQIYCSGWLGRWLMLAIFVPYFFFRASLKSLILRKNEFREYRRNRGMSIVHDWVDWLGGLPFEVARPEEVVDFLSERGFELVQSNLTKRLGCNEFLFRKIDTA